VTLTPLVGSLLLAALLNCATAAWAARRRGSPGWAGLLIAALAVGVWSGAYALELGSAALADRELWGALKYLGTTMLPVGWLLFVLQYTGQDHRISRRLLALLAVEPVTVLTLLALPATRALVRSYPPGAASAGPAPLLRLGPVYWVHFCYTNLLVLVAAVVLLVALFRVPRTRRRRTGLLLVVLAVPWLVNLLGAIHASPLGGLDYTPLALTLAAVVMTGGFVLPPMRELMVLARDSLMAALPDAVFVLDPAGRLVDTNPRAQRLLAVDRDGSEEPALPGLLTRCGRGAVPVDGDGTVSGVGRVTVDGRHYEGSVTAVLGPGGAAAGRLLVLSDVTDRARTERRLEQLAYQDPLTGLPNRQRLEGMLDEALAEAQRDGSPLGVLLVDLDRFKAVNDAWGHAAGDELLAAVAVRLRGGVRSRDTVARLGGDEFVVLLPGASLGVARGLARRLQAALVRPVQVQGHWVAVPASVGVAAWPESAADPPGLLASADRDMYRAKGGGASAPLRLARRDGGGQQDVAAL